MQSEQLRCSLGKITEVRPVHTLLLGVDPLGQTDVVTAAGRTTVVLHLKRRLTGETDVGFRFLV